MNKISIEVIEDETHPEGGHAVIRLKGLTKRPDNDAFMILPADPSLSPQDLKGWPSGARTPLNARMTDAGFEIVAGPDVVESPVLLPGTPVVVKVPAAGVSSEVLWPSITPLRRQKIKRIMTSADRRDAAARQQAEAAAPGYPNGTSAQSYEGLSSLDSDKFSAAASKQAGESAGANPSLFGTATTAAQAASAAADMAKAGGPAATAQTAAPSPMPDSDGPQVKLEEPKITIATPLDQLTEDKIRSRQIIPVRRVEPQREGRDKGTRRYATLALAVALLAAATTLISQFGRIGWPGSGSVAPAASTAPVVQIAAEPPASLYDALTVGPMSPGGVDATTVGPAAAIKKADESLYGTDGKRDQKEGAFWLKQYIGKKFGKQQTLWALTQLGSTYAQPAGAAPDYDKARLLWETATALGDPVAACFLGGLHEYGLGVKASKFEALKWYLRARDKGGCRSLEQAIKRVRE